MPYYVSHIIHIPAPSGQSNAVSMNITSINHPLPSDLQPLLTLPMSATGQEDT